MQENKKDPLSGLGSSNRGRFVGEWEVIQRGHVTRHENQIHCAKILLVVETTVEQEINEVVSNKQLIILRFADLLLANEFMNYEIPVRFCTKWLTIIEILSSSRVSLASEFNKTVEEVKSEKKHKHRLTFAVADQVSTGNKNFSYFRTLAREKECHIELWVTHMPQTLPCDADAHDWP